MLALEDFTTFFKEVHGYEPFPWQSRLLQHVVKHHGEWPATLDLPTGSGKTAAIDIAVFYLALEAERGEARCAAVRIAFVVDRRLVVDDAFARANKLAKTLTNPQGPTTERVAERLKNLACDGPALVARRLRGGIPREDDWARTPSQPTILCSTVDQVGSRLLFRGYGITDSMKPVHAGLLGSDCLILLDEAHLAEPFRQTLEWVRTYKGPAWHEVKTAAPWGVALLSATPGDEPRAPISAGVEGARNPFSLKDADKRHPVLKRRLNAAKLARLVGPISAERKSDDGTEGDGEQPEESWSEGTARDLERRVGAIVKEVRSALKHFSNAQHGALAPAIGVVVNRVPRARAVFERLKETFGQEISEGAFAEPILMIGPARAVDRKDVVRALDPIRTANSQSDEPRTLEGPLIIVATQCIEVGVDIDLDALITEHAPLDALRQRFGRLNRAGRDVVPYAAIVTMKADLAARHDDHVYGTTLKPAWKALEEEANKIDGQNLVNFGISAFTVPMTADAVASKDDAPVLLPAHMDLLSQTSPIPAADPDLALYLHGPGRQLDTVTVVWRADIDLDGLGNDEIRRLLTLVPPRSAEAIELPVWTVRAWLQRSAGTLDELADVATAEPEEEQRRSSTANRQAFCWKGDDEHSRWIFPSQLRPGDTIVVPASYGGVDRFGWNPDYGIERAASDENSAKQAVTDVAREAAEPFRLRRLIVRVAPGLLGDSVSDDKLAEALTSSPSTDWRALVDVLLSLPLPGLLRSDLESLNSLGTRDVAVYLDIYGEDDAGRRRGVVFLANRGVKESKQEGLSDSDSAPSTTENDYVGSLPGFPLGLSAHNSDVGEMAREFARTAGLSEDRVIDLDIAGELHDLGKADPRFQSWLHYGDPLGPDPDAPEQLLAKSGRRLPRKAHADSGLPHRWRHEALSVRRASMHSRLSDAGDPELVLWLIGVHHGHGRPLFPHCDPAETTPDVGPQSLAFDWHGFDWPSLFTRLKVRYGVWELARMEAIVRLADHRASEKRAAEDHH